MRSLVVAAVAGAAVVLSGAVGVAVNAADDERTDAPRVAVPDDRADRSGPPPGVREFVAAKKEWVSCVQGASRDHDGGRFDPEAACGEKPRPPAAASRPGRGATDGAGERGAGGRGSHPHGGPPGQAVAKERRPAHAGPPGD